MAGTSLKPELGSHCCLNWNSYHHSLVFIFEISSMVVLGEFRTNEGLALFLVAADATFEMFLWSYLRTSVHIFRSLCIPKGREKSPLHKTKRPTFSTTPKWNCRANCICQNSCRMITLYNSILILLLRHCVTQKNIFISSSFTSCISICITKANKKKRLYQHHARTREFQKA